MASSDPTGWIVAWVALATLAGGAALRVWNVVTTRRNKERDEVEAARAAEEEKDKRLTLLELAVHGEGPPTWSNPNPRPGLTRQMDELVPLVHAIADKVGAGP